MVTQLASSSSEKLIKATAHFLRNLAWKADKNSKQTLADSNVVPILMRAAMTVFNSVHGRFLLTKKHHQKTLEKLKIFF